MGNEKRLSERLSILVSNGIISNTIKADIEFTVKWFGDSGVHISMPIVEGDIRLNIEPRFRKFFVILMETVKSLILYCYFILNFCMMNTRYFF